MNPATSPAPRSSSTAASPGTTKNSNSGQHGQCSILSALRSVYVRPSGKLGELGALTLAAAPHSHPFRQFLSSQFPPSAAYRGSHTLASQPINHVHNKMNRSQHPSARLAEASQRPPKKVISP